MPRNLALGASDCQSQVHELAEHRGFEPRTPCLPAKWSRLFSLRHRPLASHRQHAYSTRCARLRRFLSGLVVNPVVKHLF